MKIPKYSTKVLKTQRKLSFPSLNYNFPLIINRQNAQISIDFHGHDFDELVVILEGNGIHRTDDEKRAIYAGDVFLIRRGEIHSYENTNGLKLVNVLFESKKMIYFKDEFRKLIGFNALFNIEPSRKTRSRLRLSPEQLLKVSRLIDSIEDELKKRQDGFEVFVYSYFLLFISILSRAYTCEQVKTHEPVMRLAKVISFIEKNYTSKIDIKDLSASSSMSRSSFFREFRKSTGCSPAEYATRLRIFKAMNEFIDSRGKITVKEASYKVGYSDSNYFTRQYRKIVNETPSKTRRRAKLFDI